MDFHGFSMKYAIYFMETHMTMEIPKVLCYKCWITWGYASLIYGDDRGMVYYIYTHIDPISMINLDIAVIHFNWSYNCNPLLLFINSDMVFHPAVMSHPKLGVQGADEDLGAEGWLSPAPRVSPSRWLVPAFQVDMWESQKSIDSHVYIYIYTFIYITFEENIEYGWISCWFLFRPFGLDFEVFVQRFYFNGDGTASLRQCGPHNW